MCYWIVFALFYKFGFEGNFRRPRGLVFKEAIFIERFFGLRYIISNDRMSYVSPILL